MHSQWYLRFVFAGSAGEFMQPILSLFCMKKRKMYFIYSAMKVAAMRNLNHSAASSSCFACGACWCCNSSLRVSRWPWRPAACAVLQPCSGPLAQSDFIEFQSFGASENVIDNRLSYLLDARTNSTSRLSKIEDADFAFETARLTKAQIMSKAASSMLAQANARSEVFLKLIN